MAQNATNRKTNCPDMGRDVCADRVLLMRILYDCVAPCVEAAATCPALKQRRCAAPAHWNKNAKFKWMMGFRCRTVPESGLTWVMAPHRLVTGKKNAFKEKEMLQTISELHEANMKAD